MLADLCGCLGALLYEVEVQTVFQRESIGTPAGGRGYGHAFDGISRLGCGCGGHETQKEESKWMHLAGMNRGSDVVGCLAALVLSGSRFESSVCEPNSGRSSQGGADGEEQTGRSIQGGPVSSYMLKGHSVVELAWQQNYTAKFVPLAKD